MVLNMLLGRIHRTCSIHPAAGSQFQKCNQFDGRAKPRIGAILDTCDEGCQGGDFVRWEKSEFSLPVCLD